MNAMASTLEREFDTRWLQLAPDAPLPVHEYEFMLDRKWRFGALGSNKTLDRDAIMRVLRSHSPARFDGGNNLSYPTRARFAGLCDLSTYTGHGKRAFVCPERSLTWLMEVARAGRKVSSLPHVAHVNSAKQLFMRHHRTFGAVVADFALDNARDRQHEAKTITNGLKRLHSYAATARTVLRFISLTPNADKESFVLGNVQMLRGERRKMRTADCVVKHSENYHHNQKGNIARINVLFYPTLAQTIGTGRADQ